MITPCLPSDVTAINGSKLEPESIAPFITASVMLLERVSSCMVGKGIAEDVQTNASAFLTAHLLALSGVGSDTGIKKSEKFENWSVSYITGASDMSGVKSTFYGSMANSLSGGCLQEVDKRSSGVFFAGGSNV